MSRGGDRKILLLGIAAAVAITAFAIWIRLAGCRWTCEELGASYIKTTTAACVCERDGKRFAGGHP